MAIIDVFTFNGEYDLLEIRLNILNKYVDQFIIVEAPTTFSGLVKPLYYNLQKERYTKWANKIKYYVIDENYSLEEIALAESSPNTVGATHWKHEFLQKESIKKALTHLEDDDICFIGDVDEIWQEPIQPDDNVFKLRLRVYTYYLNNKSSEQFHGTIVAQYKNIKNTCLNHLRTNAEKSVPYLGWHFTSMGGYDEVKRKLSDSYTRESYWTEIVEGQLMDNISCSRDFLGRGFHYQIDETEWPQYLKDYKYKYKHLCR
jgi:beta-1,4-mannosyl-glycoprotein beta-1,4-N-acetylglucosaminyltransferase